MPVTVVPTSLATVAMETFITELSSVIRNWPAASVVRTIPAAFAGAVVAVTPPTLARRRLSGHHPDGMISGEGGIRTLGRSQPPSHDFQSCPFNRSGTSPGK